MQQDNMDWWTASITTKKHGTRHLCLDAREEEARKLLDDILKIVIECDGSATLTLMRTQDSQQVTMELYRVQDGVIAFEGGKLLEEKHRLENYLRD